MLVGRSKKVGKMVEYHQLVVELRKRHADLEVAARIFMRYVEQALPHSGKTHWADYIHPEEETEEKSREELMGDLMFGPDPQPMRLAQVAAHRMEQGSLLRLGAEARLKDEHWVEDLEYREKRILQARKKYMRANARRQKIRQSDRESWYEAVKTVRRRALGPEVGTPVRMNQLQAALSDAVNNGKKGTEHAGTVGESALSHLGETDRVAERPKEWVEGRLHGEEDQNIAAATWALFLSMASGEETPGALPSWAGINATGGSEARTEENLHWSCEKVLWN